MPMRLCISANLDAARYMRMRQASRVLVAIVPSSVAVRTGHTLYVFAGFQSGFRCSPSGPGGSFRVPEVASTTP